MPHCGWGGRQLLTKLNVCGKLMSINVRFESYRLKAKFHALVCSPLNFRPFFKLCVTSINECCVAGMISNNSYISLEMKSSSRYDNNRLLEIALSFHSPFLPLGKYSNLIRCRYMRATALLILPFR